MVNEELLIDSVCPYGAVLNKKLDRSVCKSCKTKECLYSKKNQGIVCKGKSYDIDQIVEEAMDCSPMYFDNGGITLTGGEPTAQFEAVTRLLTKLKEKGIHTAIETNATHPDLDKVLSLIDQPIIDFKHYDSQIHKEYTCVGNETIKRNIAKVSESQQKAFIRIPLIGGFNADQKDISGFVRFFSGLDNENLCFEFLRYHEYGKDKWKKCGMEYQMDARAYVGKEMVDRFKDVFKSHGLKVIAT